MNPEIKILLVEDNPQDAYWVLHALRQRQLDSHLLHLQDGAKALDWLFGTGGQPGSTLGGLPQVVLLDLKLPKVDGFEVLRAIRADQRTALLPVVVMTSSAEERDMVASYKLGANSYIVKPMDFESFSAAVTKLGHYWLFVNHQPGHRQA